MSNGGTSPASGIITRSYKPGSIVYFENDKSEYIYVVKAGLVILTSTKPETGEEIKEEVKPGEFFGVKSSLGKYPREETAQTVKETVCLVLTLADFERLILKNVNVVVKMLRIFSNQLRRIGRTVREVLGESNTVNPEMELFKIGEYYYRVGRFQQALYAYKRYMEYYPDTKYSDVAMKRIREIDSGRAEENVGSGMSMDMSDEPGEPDVRESDDVDMTDFSLDDSGASSGEDMFQDSNGGEDSIVTEMDEFLSEPVDSDLESFSFDDEPAGETVSKADITEKFYDAMSSFSQGNFETAKDLYESILEQKDLKNDSEKKIYEKAHFEIGRTYYKMKKYKDAMNAFSLLLKSFPKSENVKSALLHIGMIFYDSGKNDKAGTYFQKVASMEPRDEVSRNAMKYLKALENK
ncbi:MAG: tetratricopeptide repeat protein [Spirochaetota bacterium]